MADEEKKRIRVVIHVPGKNSLPLPLETESDIKRLDPFSVYLMHVFAQGSLKNGGSPDKKVARSYVPRAVSEIFPGNPQLKAEKTNNSEIFWCSSVANTYIGILNLADIPLTSDMHWQIGYWNNTHKAKIEVATTLDEAIHKAENQIGKEGLILERDEAKKEIILLRDNIVLAVILGEANQLYRDVARHTARQNRDKPLN